MAKEVVISTSALNCYGSRVLTAGIDTAQYERNPILLWMHKRGYGDMLPIGRIEGIRIDGDRLIGTPVFDMNDEFAKKIADKWEKDFLRMASAGIEIIETSSDPSVLMPGQTRETITRCKLEEVSIVDIGGNDEALKLSRNGKVLELAKGCASDFLPLLKGESYAGQSDPAAEIDQSNNDSSMNKEILQLLGLPETATDQEAVSALRLLKEKADGADSLRLAGITSLVEAAIADRRINADKRDHFINLGKAAGIDSLRETLALLRPAQKPNDVIRPSTDDLHQKKEYAKLSEVPASEIAEIRAKDRVRYIQLYKAEYGCEPNLENK